jgi:Cys-tRNA(Pro)/Cys-tRNA(Cys) deacylase
MEEKTNVMRIIEQRKIEYNSHDYSGTGAVSGIEVAEALNENPENVFKTLVTVGKSGEHFVFVVPVNGELDLKKAAKTVGEKKIEMIKSKDLLPLTGYVHGGCSPIGMKKSFKTIINESAKDKEKIFFSAGKIGCQIEMKVEDLGKIINIKFADILE